MTFADYLECHGFVKWTLLIAAWVWIFRGATTITVKTKGEQ